MKKHSDRNRYLP